MNYSEEIKRLTEEIKTYTTSIDNIEKDYIKRMWALNNGMKSFLPCMLKSMPVDPRKCPYRKREYLLEWLIGFYMASTEYYLSKLQIVGMFVKD